MLQLKTLMRKIKFIIFETVKCVFIAITISLWLLFITFVGACVYNYKYGDQAYIEHYQKVFDDVVGNVNLVRRPKITFSNNPEQNAWSDVKSNQVIFTINELKSYKNNHEAALIMGHEIAHLVLKHKKSTPRDEILADKLGMFYAMKAGYDPCLAIGAWKYVIDTDGDYVDNFTHPSRYLRYNVLKMPWCSE